MSADCVFCKIITGQIPSFRLYEDEHTLAFMDINPANPGHCLVVTKEHAPNLFEVTPEALAAAARTSQKVAKAVQAALAPYGLNLLQANGPGAAQSVFHLHIHIVPRAKDDNLPINWGVRPGDMAEIAKVAEKIKAAL
ncbi:MAG: HIT family protein [Rhodospirillales bacterium]|nr:HIT family protein [Rhodospirillales bacterium]